MKRLFCILLVVFILILSGCKNNPDNFKEPANFYYQNSSDSFFNADSVIAHEIRETAIYNGKILDILNTYLEGPATDKLNSPFPNGLKVITVQRVNNCIEITFSEEFSTLSGLDLTIACSCICATVAELTGYNTVEIKTEGSFPDNSTSLVVSYDELLFMDESF